MKIYWVVRRMDSVFGDEIYSVTPETGAGEVVRSLIWSDTSKPCMMAGMTFSRALEYARKCQREMPETEAGAVA